jgi:hypothetical protein
VSIVTGVYSLKDNDIWQYFSEPENDLCTDDYDEIKLKINYLITYIYIYLNIHKNNIK